MWAADDNIHKRQQQLATQQFACKFITSNRLAVGVWACVLCVTQWAHCHQLRSFFDATLLVRILFCAHIRSDCCVCVHNAALLIINFYLFTFCSMLCGDADARTEHRPPQCYYYYYYLSTIWQSPCMSRFNSLLLLFYFVCVFIGVTFLGFNGHEREMHPVYGKHNGFYCFAKNNKESLTRASLVSFARTVHSAHTHIHRGATHPMC